MVKHYYTLNRTKQTYNSRLYTFAYMLCVVVVVVTAAAVVVVVVVVSE